MTWLISVVISLLCLAAHVLVVRFLGDRFPSVMVTPAFYTIALAVLYGIYCVEKRAVNWASVVSLSTLVPLAISGGSIGLADFFFVESINLGASVSTAMPLFLGGTTSLVAIPEVLVYKESINVLKALGILLTISGIVLIRRS